MFQKHFQHRVPRAKDVKAGRSAIPFIYEGSTHQPDLALGEEAWTRLPPRAETLTPPEVASLAHKRS